MAFPELPDDRRARPRRYRGGDAPERTGRRRAPDGPPPAAAHHGADDQDWLLGAALQHGVPVADDAEDQPAEEPSRGVRTRHASDSVPRDRGHDDEQPHGRRYRNGFDDLTGGDRQAPGRGSNGADGGDGGLDALRAEYAERLRGSRPYAAPPAQGSGEAPPWPPQSRAGGHRRQAPPAEPNSGSHRRPDAPGGSEQPGAARRVPAQGHPDQSAPGAAPRRHSDRAGLPYGAPAQGDPGPAGPPHGGAPQGPGRHGGGPAPGQYADPAPSNGTARPGHAGPGGHGGGPAPEQYADPARSNGTAPPRHAGTGRNGAAPAGRPGARPPARPDVPPPPGADPHPGRTPPGADAPDGVPGRSGRRRADPPPAPEGPPSGTTTRRVPAVPDAGRPPRRPAGPPPPDPGRDGAPADASAGHDGPGREDPTEMFDRPAPGSGRRGHGAPPEPDAPHRVGPEPDDDETGAATGAEAGDPGVGKRPGPVGIGGRLAAMAGLGKGPDGEKRQLAFWKELLLLAGVAILLTVLIQTFLAKVYVIPSGSMETTLHGCTGCTNDRVLVDKVTYGFTDVSPGDIVVFRGTDGWASETYTGEGSANPLLRGLQTLGSLVGIAPPDEKDFVKRVIAVGGQTVACCDALNQVMVDGEPLEEPYVYYLPEAGPARQIPFGPVTVPEGEYWMMGDSRNNSADSRAAGHGPIPDENVIGKVRLVVLPFDRFGWVGSADPQTTATASGSPGLPAGVPLALGIMGTLPLAASRRRALRARAEHERFLPVTRHPAGWRRRS